MKHKLELRGGSWNNNNDNCRVANRNNNTPTNRNNNIGFRVSNAITLLTKPEPIEVISFGCANKIAQLHIQVQSHRSIRNKVSRIEYLEHLAFSI